MEEQECGWEPVEGHSGDI